MVSSFCCLNRKTLFLDKERIMKSIKFTLVCCAVLALLVAGCTKTKEGQSRGGMETRDTRIGKLVFENSFPTQETTDKLREARRFHRATQAYIWALPIVSMADFVLTFKENLHMEYGQFMRLNTYEDLSFGITANATTDYLVSWINLSQDTWVLEVPAGAAAGFLNDMWQRPGVDLGVPGPNKGKGGKFLVLGPDQKEPDDTKGYRVVRSVNNNTFVLLRILETDPKRKAEMSSGIRLYPYVERKTPRQTVIEAPGGRQWSSSQPRG